jgi:hypothetical protein
LAGVPRGDWSHLDTRQRKRTAVSTDEQSPGRPGESALSRWDRNFADLLQELRVVQTGVQILFAFLLTLPFSTRFVRADLFDRVTYLVALLASAAAAGMLIAPVAYHRMLFRRRRKPEVVRSSHRMAAGGLALLAVAMVASVLLVADVVVGRPGAWVVGSVTFVWFAALWWFLPLRRRLDSDPEEDPEADRRNPTAE